MTHDSISDKGLSDVLHNMIDRAVIRAKMDVEPIWMDPQTNLIRSNTYVYAGIDLTTDEPTVQICIGKDLIPIRSIVKVDVSKGSKTDPSYMIFGTEYMRYKAVGMHASNVISPPLPKVPDKRMIPETDIAVSEVWNVLHAYVLSHGIKEFDSIDIRNIEFTDIDKAYGIMWDNGMIYEKSLNVYGYIDWGTS